MAAPTAPPDAVRQARNPRFCVLGLPVHALRRTADEVKADLNLAIQAAIQAGCSTLVTRAGMGPEVWAGEMFLRRMAQDPSLHLVLAMPYPGIEATCPGNWPGRIRRLMAAAEYVRYFRPRASRDADTLCSTWMVSRCSRLIAAGDQEGSELHWAIEYARHCSLEVTVLNVL